MPKHMALLDTEPVEHVSRADIVLSGHELPTNNIAEAKTLLMALTWAMSMVRKGGIDEVLVYMDSKLILYQLKGIYATRNPGLRRTHSHIREVIGKIREAGVSLELKWIPGDLMKKTIIGH